MTVDTARQALTTAAAELAAARQAERAAVDELALANQRVRERSPDAAAVRRRAVELHEQVVLEREGAEAAHRDAAAELERVEHEARAERYDAAVLIAHRESFFGSVAPLVPELAAAHRWELEPQRPARVGLMSPPTPERIEHVDELPGALDFDDADDHRAALERFVEAEVIRGRLARALTLAIADQHDAVDAVRELAPQLGRPAPRMSKVRHEDVMALACLRSADDLSRAWVRAWMAHFGIAVDSYTFFGAEGNAAVDMRTFLRLVVVLGDGADALMRLAPPAPREGWRDPNPAGNTFAARQSPPVGGYPLQKFEGLPPGDPRSADQPRTAHPHSLARRRIL